MQSQPFAIPAVLFFLISVPLVVGVIPRNRFYGFRTPKTMSDDRVWYRVNRVAGIGVALASIVYGAAALTWPYDRSAVDDFATWGLHLAAFAIPLVLSLGTAAWYAKRI
jgi:hypothetical protein